MTPDDMLSRLMRADLNLLPVLLVLIDTESTQATADRIGRSQSAVSHALGRLRILLGDELFVRNGPKTDRNAPRSSPERPPENA